MKKETYETKDYVKDLERLIEEVIKKAQRFKYGNITSYLGVSEYLFLKDKYYEEEVK